MGKLGVSEFRNHWTDWRKMWRGWLHRQYHHTHQKWKWFPLWGHLGKWVKHHSHVVFNFLWPQILLMQPIFTLFDSQSVSPGMLHSCRDKTTKCFCFLPFSSPKPPYWGCERHLEAYCAKYWDSRYQNYCIDSSQILHNHRDNHVSGTHHGWS